MNTAVITGASRGIGRAAAIKFASEGWNLALSCSKSAEQLEELRKNIISIYGVKCIAFTGDMGNPAAASDFIQTALCIFGSIDILVNNAGISYVGLLTDMSYDDWRKVMSSNLDSVFNCCKEAIPSMIRKKEGRIINISSVWGVSGASCEAAYSASKGGINAFTQALARELAPSNIAVNTIAFGVVDTDMNKCFNYEERNALAEEIPACRFATADEAGSIIFRLSQADTYLTGQIIKYDGGWI